MPELPQNISEYLDVTYHLGEGAFVEIKSKVGDVVWCDPWITDVYRISKKVDEQNKIKKLISDMGSNKLKSIMMSHTHGDHFADMPYLFYHCFNMNPKPKVYGGANVQALLTHYMGTKNSEFNFYCKMKEFEDREISEYPPVNSASQRKRHGIVFNLDKLDGPFDVLKVTSNTGNNKSFCLTAHPIRFEHVKVNPIFIGQKGDLQKDYNLRTELCETTTNTSCPMKNLFGFLFEIYAPFTPSSKGPCVASFGLVPGPSFTNGTSVALQEKFQKADMVYYVPQAADLVKSWKGTKRLFHTGDPSALR